MESNTLFLLLLFYPVLYLLYCISLRDSWCLDDLLSLESCEFLLDLVNWDPLYDHAHAQHLIVLLAIDMVIPGIRVLKLHLARLAVEHGLRLKVACVHTCYRYRLTQLLLGVKVSVYWLEELAFFCCHRFQRRRQVFGLRRLEKARCLLVWFYYEFLATVLVSIIFLIILTLVEIIWFHYYNYN